MRPGPLGALEGTSGLGPPGNVRPLMAVIPGFLPRRQLAVQSWKAGVLAPCALLLPAWGQPVTGRAGSQEEGPCSWPLSRAGAEGEEGVASVHDQFLPRDKGEEAQGNLDSLPRVDRLLDVTLPRRGGRGLRGVSPKPAFLLGWELRRGGCSRLPPWAGALLAPFSGGRHQKPGAKAAGPA